MRRAAVAAGAACVVVMTALAVEAHAAGPNVLLVGSYNGVNGSFPTIQSALDDAQPGDWVLVGPAVYHERQDYADGSQPAGLAITKPGIHLRGMDRNGVVVDGTKPSSPTCSSNETDQDYGPSSQGRNGIEVF